MKVYLTTKSYLTGEIKEAEGHPQTGHPNILQLNGKPPFGWTRRISKPEWHETKEEAIAQVIKEAKRKMEYEMKEIEDSLDTIEKCKLTLAKFGERSDHV